LQAKSHNRIELKTWTCILIEVLNVKVGVKKAIILLLQHTDINEDLERRSGMLGYISNLNVGISKILFACPLPYKFKKSPYKQVLFSDFP
jgi:hypothetical protein